VLLGGLSAIKDELNWFQTKAEERNLDLNISKQQTCQAYCEYMQQVAEMAYPVQATVIWAIEFAYNQAWQQPGEMVAPYNEFAQRWGNPDFTEYVKQLEKQADQALSAVDGDMAGQAESAFLKIARLEKDFWQMAYQT
jgi:thiaminase/transcriptional activator TenA